MILSGSLPIGGGEDTASLRSYIAGRSCPDPELVEDVGPVESRVAEKTFRDDQSHLGVIGELARRPPEVAAADHLRRRT